MNMVAIYFKGTKCREKRSRNLNFTKIRQSKCGSNLKSPGTAGRKEKPENALK